MSLTPRSDLSVGTRVQAQTAVIPLARKKGVTSAHVVGKKLTTLIDQNPNEFWEAAQHEFGVALQSMSLDLMDSLDARLDSLGRKVTRLEITTKEIVAIRDARAYARETESTFTAEQERAEKSLLAQWLRSFVHRLPKVRRKPALEHAIEIGLGLDAVDFAFCRYALNIAICSSHVSQQKIISSRIPNVLVGMVDGANASMVRHQGFDIHLAPGYVWQSRCMQRQLETKSTKAKLLVRGSFFLQCAIPLRENQRHKYLI